MGSAFDVSSSIQAVNVVQGGVQVFDHAGCLRLSQFQIGQVGDIEHVFFADFHDSPRAVCPFPGDILPFLLRHWRLANGLPGQDELDALNRGQAPQRCRVMRDEVEQLPPPDPVENLDAQGSILQSQGAGFGGHGGTADQGPR